MEEKPSENIPDNDEPKKNGGFSDFWIRLLRNGLGASFLRIGSAVVTVLLFAVVILITSRYYLKGQLHKAPAVPDESEEETREETNAILPYYDPSFALNERIGLTQGIHPFSQTHTDLPAKARAEVLTYTVEANDSIIGIAEKYNLNPSTILWGNPYSLGDDPHALMAGMEINILPVDGVYYEWHDGDGLNGVSDVYGVTPEDIINFPTNNLSMETIGDFSNPHIKAGTWLVIPGGSREFVNWSAPLITRENPAVASIYGPGACEAVTDGPLGSGVFIWPTVETWLSGYDYDEGTNHRAVDIAGGIGNAIYAADAGVVVYAGWNNHGYGNVVMIDHGNGWQTLYAHLDSYNVGCGNFVFAGDVIAGLGTTGNSSGPHLHYEMRYNGVPMNPHNFYAIN